MALYLRGFTNYQPHEKPIADQVKLSELVVRRDQADGWITINYLQRTPVQPGQVEWNPSP